MTNALLLFGLLIFFMLTGIPLAFGIELANISFLSITDILPYDVLASLITVFVPALSTWLPKLLRGAAEGAF